MFIYILFLVFNFVCYSANIIELPKSLEGKSVYHIKSWQLNDWSCGYNVLFNACNLEKIFTKNNNSHDYDIFSKKVLEYLKIKNKNPKGSASNKMLDRLSEILGLEKYQFLVIKDQKIKPIFSTSTKITFYHGTTQDQINALMQQAIEKREKDCIVDLKNYINKPKDLKFLHLFCQIKDQSINHLVLMSVIENRNKIRSLFIFDNVNLLVKENSQLKKYIDFICAEFKISKIDHKEYNKIKEFVPGKWSTVPNNSHSNKPH